MAVTGRAHLGRIGVKNRLVMGLVIFGEDLVKLRIGLVAVHLAGFLGHLDAAVRHERTLQGLVGLEAHDLLEILQGLVNIPRAVARKARNDLRLLIENAALCALLLLELLEPSPELVRRFGRPFEEALVPVIRCVVVLNEIADVALFLPDPSLEAIPRS